MGAQRKTIKAEELAHGDVIIDPDGNRATVRWYQWVDENRGRLSTDLGVKICQHTDRFHLA